MSNKVKVGIVLFNEVEVLDCAGPFEVCSSASKGKEKIFEVKTIAETGGIISARNGLKCCLISASKLIRVLTF